MPETAPASVLIVSSPARAITEVPTSVARQPTSATAKIVRSLIVSVLIVTFEYYPGFVVPDPSTLNL
jgi:hypothetical protein